MKCWGQIKEYRPNVQNSSGKKLLACVNSRINVKVLFDSSKMEALFGVHRDTQGHSKKIDMEYNIVYLPLEPH